MRNYLGVVLALLTIASCKDESTEKIELTRLAAIEKPIVKRFGFTLDQFHVVEDTIRSGDSFGVLMTKNNVDYPKIFKVSQEFKDTFDVRRIVAGKPYMVLKTKDSTEQAQVFIYQNDPINYTVVDFRDSVAVYTKQKPVTFKERIASGVITSSVSEAILDQGIDYNITERLSDIYAWTIDFTRLQKGDKFKVVYREKFINDTIYAGAGPIEAAYFEHNGEDFYAFPFVNDSVHGVKDYYDDDANNLRRAFLRAPVKFKYRVSSKYNLRRRIAYYGNKVRPHKGTDFAAAIGTPIIATANGTVVESTQRGGNGKYVKIKHNNTYSTQYLHMKKQKVRKGEFVKQGDVIGWIGMTGNTGGPHVCYRFWKNGRQVDPFKEKLPEAEPLAKKYREAFYDAIGPLRDKLDNVVFNNAIEEELLTENN